MNSPRPTLNKEAEKRRANLPVRPIYTPVPKPSAAISYRKWAGLLALMVVLGGITGWAISYFSPSNDDDLASLGQPLPKIEPLPATRATRETSETAGQPASAPIDGSAATFARKAFGTGPYRQGELLFRAGSPEELSALLARAQAAGGTLLGLIRGNNAARLSFPDAASMARFLSSNGAAGAVSPELNTLVSLPTQPDVPTDPFAPGGLTPFGANALAYMGIPQDNSNWGRGITVAMLDTGLAPGTTNLLKDGSISQFDMTSGQSAPNVGHGDMVASLLAGAPGEQGIAPAASIISVRVLDNNDQGDVFGVTDGIYTAIDNGAKVLNLSLGSSQPSDILLSAINYALSQGVVVVASAGNDGLGQISYPAAYPGVVAVGSIDASGQRATFSDYGSQMGLTAPGVGLNTVTVNGNMSFSGTSASAPLISGAIAGLLSTNPGMTAQQALNLITQYADFAGPYTGNSTNEFYGSGIVDMTRVLNRGNTTYTDVALADMYLNITTMPTTPTAPMQITVQNRGNTVLDSVNLNINVGGTATQQTLSGLKPGEVSDVTVNLSVQQMLNPSGVPVSARVSTIQADANPADNSKSRVVHLTPASGASTGN